MTDSKSQKNYSCVPGWRWWIQKKNPEGEQSRRWKKMRGTHRVKIEWTARQQNGFVLPKRQKDEPAEVWPPRKDLRLKRFSKLLGQDFPFTWEHSVLTPTPSLSLGCVCWRIVLVPQCTGSSWRRERAPRSGEERMEESQDFYQGLIREGFRD